MGKKLFRRAVNRRKLNGKTGIAKRYLGLQGRDDETRAVDESEKPLPSGEDLESDFRRSWVEPVNSTFQGIGLPKVRREMRNMVSSKETVSLESLSALVRSKLAADAASTLERIDSYSLDGIKDESTREQILGSVAKRSALVFGWSEQGEQASVSINLLGSMPDRTSVEVNVSEPQDK